MCLVAAAPLLKAGSPSSSGASFATARHITSLNNVKMPTSFPSSTARAAFLAFAPSYWYSYSRRRSRIGGWFVPRARTDTSPAFLPAKIVRRVSIVLGLCLPKRLLHQRDPAAEQQAAPPFRQLQGSRVGLPLRPSARPIAAFIWLSASPRPLLAIRLLLELRHGGRRTGTWRRFPAVRHRHTDATAPASRRGREGRWRKWFSTIIAIASIAPLEPMLTHFGVVGSQHFTTTRRTMSVSDTMPASARPARTQSAPRRHACSRASGTLA